MSQDIPKREVCLPFCMSRCCFAMPVIRADHLDGHFIRLPRSAQTLSRTSLSQYKVPSPLIPNRSGQLDPYSSSGKAHLAPLVRWSCNKYTCQAYICTGAATHGSHVLKLCLLQRDKAQAFKAGLSNTTAGLQEQR